MRRKILFLVILWLVPLVIAEVAGRALLHAPGLQTWPDPHVPGLRVPHQVRGFAHAANFTGRRVTVDYSHTIVTNALGMRDGPVNPAARPILALGDSFTEGMGVEQRETWSERLEASLGTPVLNAGIAAYGARQMRQAAEEFLPLVKPRLVIVGLFAQGANRIDDPYVLVGADTVRQSMASRLEAAPGGYRYSAFSRPWAVRVDFWLCRHFWLLGHAVHQAQRLRDGVEQATAESGPATTDLRPLLVEVDRLHEVTRRAGIPLAILLVNGQRPDGRFAEQDQALNQKIRQHGASRGIVVVDPMARLAQVAHGKPVLRFRRDGHWTALAHHHAADELRRVLIDERVMATVR